MYLFSGNCCMCVVGDKTGSVDMNGDPVFVGDIVQLWHCNFVGTDYEEWHPTTGLTAVVRNEFRTINHGYKMTVENDEESDRMEPFTMGIKKSGVCGGEWAIKIIKSVADIVDGERLKDFHFRFFKDLPEGYEFLPPAGSP